MSPDWRRTQAPDLAAFEVLAEMAYASLPASFRALTAGLVIRIEDFPDAEVMRDMRLESEFDILGLFTGMGLTEESLSDPVREPNIVHLYRRPILDYWAEHEETLGDLVRHVLIHEIGHHFGLSDARMDEIEAEAAREDAD